MIRFDLAAVRAKRLERATFAGLFAEDPNAEQPLTDAERAQLNEYLKHFAKPTGDMKCIGCDRPLLGFLGSFTWGLVHGSGYCSSCGYPVQMYHRLPVDIGRLQFPLQDHPDDLLERAPAGDDAVSP